MRRETRAVERLEREEEQRREYEAFEKGLEERREAVRKRAKEREQAEERERAEEREQAKEREQPKSASGRRPWSALMPRKCKWRWKYRR